MGCAPSAASNQRPAAEAGEKAVDMMYHLDGKRRLQSLVYFGEAQGL